MTDPARHLYAAEVRRHVLALREALVRHDENLAADDLMQRSVPFFLLDDPEIAQAREEQRQMVLHIRDPEAYLAYYGENPHERPFEHQYGIRPEQAHERLYRVKFLRDRLERQRSGHKPGSLSIIDLSANDGWMAVNLGQLGYTVDCIDLHPGNCELAEKRKAAGWPGIGRVYQRDLHGPPDAESWESSTWRSTYDAVVCFETVEHVADPDETLATMVELCREGGRLYLSTPFEAVERGKLAGWATVEPKGHVRVFRIADFKALCERHGKLHRLEVGPDRVMVAEVEPRYEPR